MNICFQSPFSGAKSQFDDRKPFDSRQTSR
jgi:hypothetical protein